MTSATVSRFGRYAIVAPLGAGGMGEVYRATDTRLGRTVAVKILRHAKETAAGRQRFEREAHAVSRLNHPHICALYDIGDENGIRYLVMEYVEGETLARRLSRGPLPVSEVLRYAIEIADALDHAHRAGIVHRDLKPANVMLTRTVHGHGYAFAAEVEDEQARPLAGGTANRPVVCWLTSSSREVALRDGEQIAGRDPGADIRLDSPKVSRRHARFIVDGSSVIVEDLESKNGTFVAGKRIAGSVALKPCDEVQIGPFTFVFQVEIAPSSTETEASVRISH